MTKELEDLLNKARAAQLWPEGAYISQMKAKAAFHLTMERAQQLADILAEVVAKIDEENA